VAATSNGQLISFSRKVIDPRRPFKSASKMTNEEKEEGLIPYHPVLEENPKSVLSYDYNVAKVKHLEFFPSGLESTSLVLAYGVDTFLTRTSPSLSFDTLGDEFSRSTLVTVIAGLMVGIVIAKQWASQQKLRQDWN
jgi:ER membrane protein complex subunit 1